MMKKKEGEIPGKMKRRLSLPDNDQCLTATSSNLNKKRKILKKAEKTTGLESVLSKAKISKRKANGKNQTQHVCDKCRKEFEDSFDVVAHHCTSFVCSLCSKQFDSDRSLKNHELTHMNVDEELPKKQCKFCDSKFDSSTSLAKHEEFCKNRNFKQCSMCNKKMHPYNKREFCKKCILLIGENSKDYSLRRNSKDSALLENFESSGVAETVKDLNQSQPVNDIIVNNTTTKRKINKSGERSKRAKNCLSYKSTKIHETATNIVLNHNDISKNDTHINIRKTFVKSKKVFSDKTTNSLEKTIETVSDEAKTPSLFKKPKSVVSVTKHISNQLPPNNNTVSFIADKSTKNPVKKSAFETAVLKQKPFSFNKQDSYKTVEITVGNGNVRLNNKSSFPSVQNEMRESSFKSGCNSGEKITVEKMMNLLPDSKCGILLKTFRNDVNYQCVKCCKQFGNVNHACSHCSSCEIKFIKLRKEYVSFDNVIWVCTVCNSHFDRVPKLMKHRMTCSNIFPHSSKNLKVTTYHEQFSSKCKKCGFTSSSSITFRMHPCEKNLKSMKNCFVDLNNSRTFELKPKNAYFYHCKFCELDFINPNFYVRHMREKHGDVYDGSVKPLSLQIVNRFAEKSASYSDSTITQTASFESVFSLSSSNSNHIRANANSTCGVLNYRVPRLIEPVPYDLEMARKCKELIGCECIRDEFGNRVPDSKPCTTCLKRHSANLIPNMIESEKQKSKHNEEFQDQLSFNMIHQRMVQSSTSEHHPRSFPTPPATPDSAYGQSQSSSTSESDISASSASTSTDHLGDDISVQIENMNLELSWNHSSNVDAFAMVESENDLTVSHYICARESCYLKAVNKYDLCKHLFMQHNKIDGEIIASYIK